MEQGGKGQDGGMEVQGVALIGLSRLHLQQPQHRRVVPEFHPPLGGQAYILSKVVYSSCTETRRQENAHETPATRVPVTLVSFL